MHDLESADLSGTSDMRRTAGTDINSRDRNDPHLTFQFLFAAVIQPGQRRAVVDAVARHGHRVPLFLKRADECLLLVGEHSRTVVVDARLAGHLAGGRLTVAGEHPDRDALFAQLPDSLRRPLFQTVGDPRHGQRPLRVGEPDDGFGLPGHPLRRRAELFADGDAVFVEQGFVSDVVGTSADDAAHATPAPAAPAAHIQEVLPAYRDLYEQNPDLIGWLTIDGTDIDLPVVQTPGDNEYYLRRGFDRFYAVGGTLFLDERCSVSTDAPTANWLIYGHNMHDGSMFGQLVRYRDEDFYKAHPTFTFDTLYEGGTWQVVAAVDTALGADTLPYYTFFDADTKLDWQHRVAAITEKSLYDTGVTPAYGTQLLTLSTCGDTRIGTDARFALLAVRVG